MHSDKQNKVMKIRRERMRWSQGEVITPMNAIKECIRISTANISFLLLEANACNNNDENSKNNNKKENKKNYVS